jgi:hypothetical protein
MAVTYISGHNVTFEEANCEVVAPKAAVENTNVGRIFVDEEHEQQGWEFLPVKQAGKVNWVSLFLNQLRYYY